MIDTFLISSLPFILAGTIFTFIQLKNRSYDAMLTKCLALVLLVCLASTLPMSCMIWENRVCDVLPFQMELFFIGYIGMSLALIATPTLIGQAIAAPAHRINMRFGS